MAKRRPKSPDRRELYIIVGLVLLSVLIGSTVLPRLFPAGGKLVNQPAPDFTLPVVSGGEPGARIRLSQLQGSVVILDFWATWCKPCAPQSQILEKLARSHPNDLIVVGVNVDDEPAQARGYARKLGLSYPIVVDETGEVQSAYGASTLPTVVVIDKQGKLAEYIPGLARLPALEKLVADLR